MALLNSSDYGALAGLSDASSGRKRGMFISAFITGDIHPGQEVGKFQVMYDMDSEPGKFLINNAESINFIPLFIKRFWQKKVKMEGKQWDQVVAFGWDESTPKLDDQCKYCYVIAGFLLDADKKVITLPEDIENSDAKAGDKALVYFKCDGVRFSGAMALTNHFEEKSKELSPLSDNPKFEKEVVTPRRFICEATIDHAETDFGTKRVYKFDTVALIPDEQVQGIMKAAVDLSEKFVDQFDKTSLVAGNAATTSQKSEGLAFNTQDELASSGGSEAPPNTSGEDSPSFDLGI